jgi:pyruvate/2-oxoglutarate dehydrogenase complex dihydrolipoamide acyltransferase (E2) component
MLVPIIMPQLGESIAEATVVNIAVGEGDSVSADQEIMEVETNKALLQVTTPCAGSVMELIAEARQTYEVGAVLGYIEATADEIERLGLKPSPAPDADAALEADHSPDGSDLPEMPTDVVPARSGVTPVVPRGGLPVPAALAGAGYLTPRAKARLAELGLSAADLAAVAGSGAGGRVTIKDFENFLTDLESRPLQPAPAMRVAVADSMRRSWTRPLATAGRPLRLDPLFAHRKLHAEPRPGIALYVLRALALALGEDSAPANRLMGKRIVTPAAIDIGFAVEVENGLVVPVMRGADKTPLATLAEDYQRLIAAARRRQLPPEAGGEAIATVTNFGAFGITWATPIPLPDQSLMVGLGAGRTAPHWDEAKGAFVPIIEAEMTLSFDHRVLDGGGAGRLLERIVQLLAQPEQL